MTTQSPAYPPPTTPQNQPDAHASGNYGIMQPHIQASYLQQQQQQQQQPVHVTPLPDDFKVIVSAALNKQFL